jgi:coproporphyrinogen III oxidase-like Fe-S oxidoreductase
LSKTARARAERVRKINQALKILENEGYIIRKGPDITLTEKGFNEGFDRLISLYAEEAWPNLTEDQISPEMMNSLIDLAIGQDIIIKQGETLSLTDKGQKYFIRNLIEERMKS